jgi:hypothetical protein
MDVEWAAQSVESAERFAAPAQHGAELTRQRGNAIENKLRPLFDSRIQRTQTFGRGQRRIHHGNQNGSMLRQAKRTGMPRSEP